jgi:hypothetical protein
VGEETRSRRLGDATSYCLHGCLDAVVKVELGENAGDVVSDDVCAQREVVRDVVIALTTGELAEDLELSFGQGGADCVPGVFARSGDQNIPLIATGSRPVTLARRTRQSGTVGQQRR